MEEVSDMTRRNIEQADLCIEWLLQFAPEGAFQEWLEAQPWYDIPEPAFDLYRPECMKGC